MQVRKEDLDRKREKNFDKTTRSLEKDEKKSLHNAPTGGRRGKVMGLTCMKPNREET